jgi:hypothetical protein
MIRFFLFVLFLFTQFLFCQEIKITVIDSLNQSPIQEAIALNSEGQFISKSNEIGLLSIDANLNSFIYVVANGYEQIQISPTQNTDLICKLIKKPEILHEVIIGNKRKAIKYGNFNLHRSMFTNSQNCSAKFNYLVCATKLIVSNNPTVVFYNFCISSESNNSPFNFQIYNDKHGVPDQVIYSQYIKDYKKGWNRVAISDTNLMLDSGTYYIAMQWLPSKDKSDVWFFEADGKKYYSIGQTLVMNKGDGKQFDSYMYNFDKWQHLYMKGSNYAHYIETFEN